MAYKVFVYDKEKKRVGELQNISTLTWREDYYGFGEVMATVAFTPDMESILKRGSFLHKSDSAYTAYIEHIDKRDDVDEPYIEVRAYGAKKLLNKRVGMGNIVINNIEDDLIDAINLNLRGLDLQVFNTFTIKSDVEALEFDFFKLGDIANNSLLKAKKSYKVLFDPYSKIHTCMLYEGVVRSEGTFDYVGYLGDDIGTIKSTNIIEDETDFSNYAIILADEGRTYSIGNPEYSGRVEGFIDLSSQKITYERNKYLGDDANGYPLFETTQHRYTDAEYEALIMALASVEFEKMKVLVDVSFEVSENDLINIDKQFNLGDVLPVRNSKFNYGGYARVTQVTYTLDSSGYDTLLTFETEVI